MLSLFCQLNWLLFLSVSGSFHNQRSLPEVFQTGCNYFHPDKRENYLPPATIHGAHPAADRKARHRKPNGETHYNDEQRSTIPASDPRRGEKKQNRLELAD